MVLLPQANKMYGIDSVASSKQNVWYCCLKQTKCMVQILLPQANKMYGIDSVASSKQHVWYRFCCLKQTTCMVQIQANPILPSFSQCLKDQGYAKDLVESQGFVY